MIIRKIADLSIPSGTEVIRFHLFGPGGNGTSAGAGGGGGAGTPGSGGQAYCVVEWE
jgi:hypothetical protein